MIMHTNDITKFAKIDGLHTKCAAAMFLPLTKSLVGSHHLKNVTDPYLMGHYYDRGHGDLMVFFNKANKLLHKNIVYPHCSFSYH